MTFRQGAGLVLFCTVGGVLFSRRQEPLTVADVAGWWLLVVCLVTALGGE